MTIICKLFRRATWMNKAIWLLQSDTLVLISMNFTKNYRIRDEFCREN